MLVKSLTKSLLGGGGESSGTTISKDERPPPPGLKLEVEAGPPSFEVLSAQSQTEEGGRVLRGEGAGAGPAFNIAAAGGTCVWSFKIMRTNNQTGLYAHVGVAHESFSAAHGGDAYFFDLFSGYIYSTKNAHEQSVGKLVLQTTDVLKGKTDGALIEMRVREAGGKRYVAFRVNGGGWNEVVADGLPTVVRPYARCGCDLDRIRLEKAPAIEADGGGATAGSSAGFYTCAEAKTAGFTLMEMRTCGYTCADAKTAGYTLAEMRAGGFTCADAKAAGYVEGLKAAGFTCAEAKTAGYTLAEMRLGGYTCVETKAGGYTCADAKAAGYTLAQMRAGGPMYGYTCLEAKTVGYTLTEMRVGGFTCAEVKEAGYVMGLKEAGYTCLEAKAAGYMLAGIRAGGYDSTEVKAAGYTLAEMRVGGYTGGLKALGYTCAEAKAAGYVMGLKEAGYTCAEAKAGDYTCAQVKMAGYTLAEMRAAGFTCAEAKAAGYNPKESMQAGFTYQEGLAVGYPSHIDGHATNVTSWNFGMQPSRLESRISLPALPPPPREPLSVR